MNITLEALDCRKLIFPIVGRARFSIVRIKNDNQKRFFLEVNL